MRVKHGKGIGPRPLSQTMTRHVRSHNDEPETNGNMSEAVTLNLSFARTTTEEQVQRKTNFGDKNMQAEVNATMTGYNEKADNSQHALME